MITAREIPPSVHNRGLSATGEQAIAEFKIRGAATTAETSFRGRLARALSRSDSIVWPSLLSMVNSGSLRSNGGGKLFISKMLASLFVGRW